MSSTRYAQAGEPLNQERYMSSPEYAELHGVSGVAIAKRAALVDAPELRRLLWFLQAKSLEPGGLKMVAADLCRLFPNRVKPISRPFGLHRAGTPLDTYLLDLCINPRIRLLPADSKLSKLAYDDRALEDFPGLAEGEFTIASAPTFREVVGALLEYQKRCEDRARDEFILTGLGERVWKTLDHALARKGMVLIEGLEGRGKTESARAWCNSHPALARLVSLKGITGKTNVFRAIAKALGIASGYGYKATELQNRVEDVLHRSRLMLVIDEAHFLFDPRPRMSKRPELVDWLDTALCNYLVPVALVSTPQLLQSVHQAVEQVGWNWKQFQRRVKRFEVLPDNNSKDDIERVARKLLPGAADKTVNLAVGYALVSKRDLSALGDVIEEARLLAKADGEDAIAHEHVKRAVDECLIPSDAAFAQRLSFKGAGRKPRPSAEPAASSLAAAAGTSEGLDAVNYKRAPRAGYLLTNT